MVTCFISYSWDSTEHKSWVRRLAESLQSNGVKTYLDQWDVKLGTDLPQYMETSIRASNFVLLICTPSFCKKANSGVGGVGYEKSIVTGEIFSKTAPSTKFIPVLRAGIVVDSLPSYLKSKAYIDFTNDEKYEQNLIELLRNIYDEPLVIPPSLGTKPDFSKSIKALPESISVGTNIDVEQNNRGKSPESIEINTPEGMKHFQQLVKFAMSSNGLGLYSGSAREWAMKNLNAFSIADTEKFQQLVKFAMSSNGLGLYSGSAREWAMKQLKK